MSERRVVVTGVGMITPLGHSLDATLDALAAGASAVRPATLFDASGFRCRNAAEVRDWDPRPAFRAPKALKLTDRAARFAVAAAQAALADAGWPADPAGDDQLGVAIGSSGSDLQARDLGRALANDATALDTRDIATFADRIMGGLNPLWLLISLPNMISAHVGIQLGARGPNTTVMTDWVAGSQAIGEASEWIRCGEADAVLAGGADSGVQPFAYTAFQQAGWFDDGDGDRGFVPGEGAAMLLLEERMAALRRGARCRAEITAYATRPPQQMQRLECPLAQTLCDAMASAGWRRQDVTSCHVAAPPILAFSAAAGSALHLLLAGVPAREAFDARLGHPLAAAGPIDAAMMLRSSPRGARVLASAIGSSGEAVTLALQVGTET